MASRVTHSSSSSSSSSSLFVSIEAFRRWCRVLPLLFACVLLSLSFPEVAGGGGGGGGASGGEGGVHVPVGEKLRNLLLDVSAGKDRERGGGGAALTIDTGRLQRMLHDDAVRGSHDVRDVQFVLGFLLTSGLLPWPVPTTLQDRSLFAHSSPSSSSSLSSSVSRPPAKDDDSDIARLDRLPCMKQAERSQIDAGLELYFEASGISGSSRHVDPALPFAPPGALAGKGPVRGSGSLEHLASLIHQSAGHENALGLNPHFERRQEQLPSIGQRNRQISEELSQDGAGSLRSLPGSELATIRPRFAFASSSAAKSPTDVTKRGQSAYQRFQGTDVASKRTPPPRHLALASSLSPSHRNSWDGCDIGGHFLPVHAIDGDAKTRWAAAPSDKSEWIVLKLSDRPVPLHRVHILWESSAALHFTIEISNGTAAQSPHLGNVIFDSFNWTPVVNKSYPDARSVELNFTAAWSLPAPHGVSQIDEPVDGKLSIAPPTAQYVRVQCLTRKSPSWGCSIWEFHLQTLANSDWSRDNIGNDAERHSRPVHFGSENTAIAELDLLADLHPHFRRWSHDAAFRTREVDIIEASLKQQERDRRMAMEAALTKHVFEEQRSTSTENDVQSVPGNQTKPNNTKAHPEAAEFLVESMHFPSLLALAHRYRRGYDLPHSDALATTIFGVLADGVRVATAMSGKSAFRATRIDRPEDLQVRDRENVQVNRLESELELLQNSVPLDQFDKVPVELDTIAAGSQLHESVARIQTLAYNLGVYHQRGQFGLLQNTTLACRFYNTSFSYGKLQAAESLGGCYKFGRFDEYPANATRAKAIYEYAAERGNAAASVALGQLYHFSRRGIRRNVTRAIELYHQAESMVHAHFLLGALHFEGDYYRFKDGGIEETLADTHGAEDGDEGEDGDEREDEGEQQEENGDEDDEETDDGESEEAEQTAGKSGDEDHDGRNPDGISEAEEQTNGDGKSQTGRNETKLSYKKQRQRDRARARALKKQAAALEKQSRQQKEIAQKQKAKPKVINAAKAVQYLSTAARYKHTAASFLLAQIYYEGRGSKDVPGYFVEPDLAKSFEHFQRIASQHASSSLEAAFDAYSSGNTSLALLLYLLHAEMGSTPARLNALFLLDVNSISSSVGRTKPTESTFIDLNQLLSSFLSSTWDTIKEFALPATQSIPLVGPALQQTVTPRLTVLMPPPPATASPSKAPTEQSVNLDSRTRTNLLRRLVEHGLSDGDHDSPRILSDHFLHEAGRVCLPFVDEIHVEHSSAADNVVSSDVFLCLLQYHYFGYATLRRALDSTTVGKVAADDVPTLFKLASFCFFVNFDCQFFSRMYEREVSTADIMSDPDDDSRMLSTRERWRKIALEFFDSAVVGLETAHEGQSQDGSSRSSSPLSDALLAFCGPGQGTNYSQTMGFLDEALENVHLQSKPQGEDAASMPFQPLDWVVPLLKLGVSTTATVFKANLSFHVPKEVQKFTTKTMQVIGGARTAFDLSTIEDSIARNESSWQSSVAILAIIVAATAYLRLHHAGVPQNRPP